MSILIGADIVPTKRNIDLFCCADLDKLIGSDLQRVFDSHSYRIFNLETPVTDVMDPIAKNGPCLSAPQKVVKGFKGLGIDLFCVGNNHILDQGYVGFEDTLRTLDTNGIAHVGGGNNLIEARKPFYFEDGSKRIGVYACVEHEFSGAGENTPGANLFDPLYVFDDVKKAANNCDYLVVLCHGGKEEYRYPSPALQERCRKLIDSGAYIVICQHSHCIGCKEDYNNGVIVYGQGNFIFDDCDNEYWATSLLISIDDDLNVSYIPVEKHDECVRLAIGMRRDQILNDFKTRSEEIKIDLFVKKTFGELSSKMLTDYLWNISGCNKSFILRVMNKLSGYRFSDYYMKKKYDKSQMIKVLNYIECESHRDLLIEGLKSNVYDAR